MSNASVLKNHFALFFESSRRLTKMWRTRRVLLTRMNCNSPLYDKHSHLGHRFINTVTYSPQRRRGHGEEPVFFRLPGDDGKRKEVLPPEAVQVLLPIVVSRWAIETSKPLCSLCLRGEIMPLEYVAVIMKTCTKPGSLRAFSPIRVRSVATVSSLLV